MPQPMTQWCVWCHFLWRKSVNDATPFNFMVLMMSHLLHIDATSFTPVYWFNDATLWLHSVNDAALFDFMLWIMPHLLTYWFEWCHIFLHYAVSDATFLDFMVWIIPHPVTQCCEWCHYCYIFVLKINTSFVWTKWFFNFIYYEIFNLSHDLF